MQTMADDSDSNCDSMPPPRPKRQWGRTAARQAAAVSSKLAPVVRGAGDRVAAASATTLLLGLLGVLLISSVVAGLTSDGSLGVAATVLFIPMLSGLIGAIGMRCLDERRRTQAQQDNAVIQILQAKSNPQNPHLILTSSS